MVTNDDDGAEYEVLAEGEGTWRSVPVTEGDLCWRCPKCGLVVTDLTVEQVESVAETHEEFVHRLGLYIPGPPADTEPG